MIPYAVPSERKLKRASFPNTFHGSDYPLTLWFYADCFDRELEDGEEVGIQTLEDCVKVPQGILERAYLYWMIDLDGTGSVHSLGRRREA